MSRFRPDRRQFLTLPLALVLAPLGRLHAEPQARRAGYTVDVGILYHVLSFELTGTLDERVDREGGTYEVAAVGQGSGIQNRIESHGVRQGGRWAPLQALAWFQVAGREARSEITYDYRHRTIDYHYRGETFFLRRRRIADDRLPIPEGMHVDDVISATLNYADGLWAPQADGTFTTYLVRRRRPRNEGPDDVQEQYRAELVPFVMRVAPDPETGKPTALVDLSGFSSWARQGQPARVVFGPRRRPETITASLMLGTSVSIRLASMA